MRAPEAKQSTAEAAFNAVLESGAVRGVLHDYFDERFRDAARIAASPNVSSDERTAWCSQMAVWLSLSDMTKGK